MTKTATIRGKENQEQPFDKIPVDQFGIPQGGMDPLAEELGDNLEFKVDPARLLGRVIVETIRSSFIWIALTAIISTLKLTVFSSNEQLIDIFLYGVLAFGLVWGINAIYILVQHSFGFEDNKLAKTIFKIAQYTNPIVVLGILSQAEIYLTPLGIVLFLFVIPVVRYNKIKEAWK